MTTLQNTSTSAATKNLPKNIIFNIVSFGIKLLLGLILTPFFVKNLGVAIYGLIPLALIFSEYASLIAQSFNLTTSRFLTIELNKKSNDRAVKIFNSSIFVMFVVVIVQFLLFLCFIFNLNLYLQIPNGYEEPTRYLFLFTYIGLTFTVLASIFNIALYSKNRLDLIQLNEILKQIVIVILIAGLFFFKYKNLISVGLANLFGGVVVLFVSLFQWKKFSPNLTINLKKIDIKVVKPLLIMTFWVIINTVGALLYIRIDAYVVNKFIGPEASGQYSAVLQFSQVFRTAVATITNAIAPLSVIYVANNETEKLINLYKIAVKYLTLSLAPILALMCAFSNNILMLWLGRGFSGLGLLMTMQLAPLLVNLGIYPLLNLNISTNNVKFPAIITCFLGVLNLMVAIMIVKHTNLGFYGVAIAGAIMLTLKNFVFTPLYAARILKVKSATFYAPLLTGIVMFVGLFFVFKFFEHFYNFKSFMELILFSIVVTIVAILFSLRIFAERSELNVLRSALPMKFKKMQN